MIEKNRIVYQNDQYNWKCLQKSKSTQSSLEHNQYLRGKMYKKNESFQRS